MPSLPAHPDAIVQSEETVWNGRFPLQVVRFRHRRFDGTMSGPRTWEMWRRGPAAAMLPYDPAADAVVLIEQFRLPALAAGLDPVMVELPAGLCDPGEAPADAIARELREEMGLTATRTERIGQFLLTPGGSDECCTLFAGCVTAPSADAGGIAGTAGLAAEQEDIRLRVHPAASAIDAALAGAYANSVTAIALLWFAAMRDRLRREWSTA
ncbi:MAG TPA: NUDIX domain-containing protein [Acetobacteraceae bacterium]|nr:NUDIX domain-containing protein [Acetobacteraceae bacterium]